LRVQEVFDLALLTFEDTWKAGVQHRQAPGGAGSAQLVAQCFAKVYGTLNEIIHKVSVLLVSP
jgi:hypothetical protein